METGIWGAKLDFYFSIVQAYIVYLLCLLYNSVLQNVLMIQANIIPTIVDDLGIPAGVVELALR